MRWASPVIWMRRTATQDVEVGGHQFKAGDKMIMFYNSANRDETVFTNADTFDIARDPTRTSASAPAARTSASARTWLAARSASRSARCSSRCPTSKSRASPTGCSRRSSTASSGCRCG